MKTPQQVAEDLRQALLANQEEFHPQFYVGYEAALKAFVERLERDG